jgi:hypothetical protein
MHPQKSRSASICVPTPPSTSSTDPLVIAEQGHFWVGVRRQITAQGTVSTGQMFVQYQLPAVRSHPYPIVMVHGGGGQGLDFLATPDGRS